MRLIDADAFIEDIKTEIVNLYLDGLKGTPRPTDELYDIIDRIGEQPTIEQPTWISVENRLPTEGMTIEMFFPVSQSICLGYYREIAKTAFWCVKLPDGTGRITDEKPTHWKYRYITETPQPPKGAE